MYNYKFKRIDEDKFDDFAQNHSFNNIFQTSAWAKVKKNWNNLYFAVYKNDKIVAAALILVREVKFGFKFAYINKGPLLDFNDQSLLEYFFDNLKYELKKRKIIFLKVDPKKVILKGSIDDKEMVKNASDKNFIESMNKCGLKHSGYSLSLHDTIQPRVQMTFEIDDDIDAVIGSKTMKKVRSSIRKGVYFKFENDANNLANLINFTEQRHDIKLRDKEYFQLILDSFADNATVLTAFYDGKAISSCLLVKSKDICEILYSGYNDEYKKLKSTYPMRYKAIEYARDNGCKYFNFGGVQGTLDDGLTIFKSSFRPKVYVYAGEFEMYPYKLISRLAAIFYQKMK